jgi:UDP-GlcNAc:undecaprenyl-phosphate GlcNAc-1-phosphate transferase
MCFVLVNARTPWRGQAAVFMGDAGSMFLGFAITWFFIDLSQAPVRAVPPVTALWLLLIPLFDTVWLLFKRPLTGHWPTAASHDHLHHVFQLLGLEVGKATMVLWFVAALAAGVGIAGTVWGVSEATLFYSFLALFAAYSLAMSVVWRRCKPVVDDILERD